jgi:hypothetical protein
MRGIASFHFQKDTHGILISCSVSWAVRLSGKGNGKNAIIFTRKTNFLTLTTFCFIRRS